jgi:hypothetical protein
LYAHPFDLAALAPHGGLPRLRALGFAELVVATSYHDGRWLMPWHPEGMVRFLEDGTVHYRPGRDYGRLVPQPSSLVPATGPSPLASWCAAAPAAGIAVRAWTVFTHNSRLGERHPELCVQNAFGDAYRYALCPAQPAVQQYVTTMVADLASQPGLGSIELEALGQMGWKHSSHHDKASFTPSGLLDAALSACCCSACAATQRRLGHDPVAVKAAVRTLLEQQLRDGDAMAPGKLPGTAAELAAAGGAPWLDAVLATRAATLQDLGRAVVAAAGSLRRAVQVHPSPWFTGSQLAVAAARVFPPEDERVLTAYGEGPEAIGKLLAHDATRGLPNPPRLCLWPKAPQFSSDQDLAKIRELAATHRVTALGIYHLGLLPWRTLERVAKILGA